MSSMHLAHIRQWIYSSPPVEWSLNHLNDILIGALQCGPIPRHVAFVMDGNRRFARSRKIEVVEGHNMGFEALAGILEICYKCGVKAVTVYAFSIENFNRSKYEVDALMEMAKLKLTQIAQHGDLLDKYGAKIRVVGNWELLRPDVMEAMERTVKMTEGNNNCVLNICFPYTARDEITTAIRRTVEDFSEPLHPVPKPFSQTRITQKIRSQHLSEKSQGSASPHLAPVDSDDAISTSTTLHADSPPASTEGGDVMSYPDPETITAETVASHLFTAEDPPVDLLIRTSGVRRLSDFMLWQCHDGTELSFSDCFWPEFDLWKFLPILVEWQWRRKFVDEKENTNTQNKVNTAASVKVR